MKREKDSTDTGFLANLRRNVLNAISPSEPETEPSINAEHSEASDAETAPEERTNSVGKKIFDLKVSDAAAIRPPLPAGYVYPDAEEAARLHAELLRQLPSSHPLFGVPLETFAACERNDDTLFRYRGNPRLFALIHLAGLSEKITDEKPSGVIWSGTFEAWTVREKSLSDL